MKLQVNYSGTPLIWPPLGPKKLAILMVWPYYRGIFLQENEWQFLPGSQKKWP